MTISLFSQEGLIFVLRWLHTFFGVMWIGLLYYFNFIQGPFFAEIDAATKNQAFAKLVPRAMWWFRYGALWTMFFGLVMLLWFGHQGGAGWFTSAWGIKITTGSILGLVMGANVWFVIWPNQQKLIANAVGVLAGKPADPGAAAAGPKALLASRTNVLFSIPMLFFMASSRHLPLVIGPESKVGLYYGAFLVIVAALEYNALKGKLGPLEKIKGVITSGFVLAFALYGLLVALS